MSKVPSRVVRDSSGECLLIVAGRAARPYDFRSTPEQRRERCPFCPGREDQTPPEVDAIRPDGSDPDGPGWTLRVVPNRFPAYPREPGAGQDRQAAFGVHEVIIETPRHECGLADLSTEEVAAVLRAWQRRLKVAREDERLRCGIIFKNQGQAAGASLEHSHSQLMASPFLPRRTLAELEEAREGRAEEAFQRDVDSRRVIEQSAAHVAYTPEASRFPYEVRVAPAAQQPRFEDTSEAIIATAAASLQRLLSVRERLHPSASAYHLVVYTAPFRETNVDGFRWSIELFPRISQIAGFELATGVFVNQVDPDSAAKAWRKALSEGASR